MVVLTGALVVGAPAALRAQPGLTKASVSSQGVLVSTGRVPLQGSSSMPVLSPERRAWLGNASANVNRPRPSTHEDGVLGLSPRVPESAPALSTDLPQAPTDYLSLVRPLTDVETDNSTSVINEPSVAAKWPLVFLTGNWFAAISTDGTGSFSYIDPDAVLPPIADQFFCCDQSVIYERSRGMFIWIVLYINAAQTTGTIRIVVSDDLTSATIYDISSATFGLAGLPDYPHIALGANSLYLTINHFNPSFTQTTIARFPLTELKQHVTLPYSFTNRPEFNAKVAHDYGPGTKAYWATHINNTTLRLFRWEEGSFSVFFSDITIPAWTRGGRGSFACPTPSGSNPCARMDDRVLGGFVTSRRTIPSASTAQKVVGFSWNTPQGGSFPFPYTNVIRIDAEALTVIDNPALWNSSVAFVYADLHPNDRGDLGGVVDVAGTGQHPMVNSILADGVTGSPAPWALFFVRAGNNSPASNAWGDYNTVRRVSPFGYLYVLGGHTLQGGAANGNVESVFAGFGREGDLF
jgi:hypothetical protein